MLRPPIEPMLAKTVHALPEPVACVGGCVFEPKFDGFRAIVFHQPGGVYIQSRAGRPLHGYFPDIADIVAAALPVGVVLDGELIIWAGGRTSFTLLQRRLNAGAAVRRIAAEHPAHLVVFDLLQRADGTPLLNPTADAAPRRVGRAAGRGAGAAAAVPTDHLQH
jgi:ATP-dependent DNA ligase